MPAEWEPQASVWLSWPFNKDTWPDISQKYQKMISEYCLLVKAIAKSQKVNINCTRSARRKNVMPFCSCF